MRPVFEGLPALLLGLVPRQWRNTVAGDLQEEWSGSARRRSGPGSQLRLCLQVVWIGLRLRVRQLERTAATGERSVPPRFAAGRLPDQIRQDTRQAVRLMARAPLLTILTVLTMGIGIGATTAIFGVINTVFIRPLPFPDGHRIVELSASLYGPDHKDFPEETFDKLRQESRTLEALAFYQETEVTLTGTGLAQVVAGAAVSAGMADVLGVEMAIGRQFGREDEPEGNNRVAVVSHDLWRTALGSDPSVLSRRLHIDGAEHQIIGVLPPDIGFPQPETAVWVPYTLRAQGSFGFSVVPALGRLAAGVELAQAEAEVDSYVRGHWEKQQAIQEDAHVSVTSLSEARGSSVRPALLSLLAGVTLMLLIGCANVANLLLALGSERRAEFALRTALGAGRSRILQQLLVESLVLAFAGALAGLLLAHWGLAAIVALAPAEIPRLDELSLDTTVVLFAAVVAGLTALIFGLAPALESSRQPRAGAFAIMASGSSRPCRMWVRRGLIVAETAGALVLLVAGGLLLNSFVRLSSVDPGYDPDRVLTARAELPIPRYRGEEGLRFFEELAAQLSQRPQVERVGLGSGPPFSKQWTMVNSLRINGQHPERSMLAVQYASPDYFRALRIELIEGRHYQAADLFSGSRPAVVNSAFARTYLAGQQRLGTRIDLPPGQFRVIGVTADSKQGALDEETSPQIYLPFRYQSFSDKAEAFVVVKTRGDPMAVAPALTDATLRMDSEVLPKRIATLRSQLSGSLSQPRFYVTVAVFFGVVAITMVAVGVYGVLSYTVSRRTREIGVRMAVGASPGSVLNMVLLESVLLIALGVGLGVPASLGASRLLTGHLFGIGSTDPVTYAAVIAFLVAVGVAATYLPARRATQVDPTLALRYE